MNDIIADLEKLSEFRCRSLDSRSQDKIRTLFMRHHAFWVIDIFSEIQNCFPVTLLSCLNTVIESIKCRNRRKQADAWKKFNNPNPRFVIINFCFIIEYKGIFSQLLTDARINISSVFYVTDRLIRDWQDVSSTLSEKTVTDPVKKTLVTLLCLALLTRDAPGHCWRQCVVAPSRRKRNKEYTVYYWRKFVWICEFGCHAFVGICTTLQHWNLVQQGGKVWQAPGLITPSFVDVAHLFEVRVRWISRLLRIRICSEIWSYSASRWSLHSTDNSSQSSGSSIHQEVLDLTTSKFLPEWDGTAAAFPKFFSTFSLFDFRFLDSILIVSDLPLFGIIRFLPDWWPLRRPPL